MSRNVQFSVIGDVLSSGAKYPNDPADWPFFVIDGELEIHECGPLLIRLASLQSAASIRAVDCGRREVGLAQEERAVIRAERRMWEEVSAHYKDVAKAVSRMLTQKVTEATVIER